MVAGPSADSANGGLDSSAISGRGLVLAYSRPSLLGCAERHRACWWVSIPPLARIRPVLCFLLLNPRDMAVIACKIVRVVHRLKKEITTGWATYMHRIVVSCTAKGSQPT